jgi:hypothetical protein
MSVRLMIWAGSTAEMVAGKWWRKYCDATPIRSSLQHELKEHNAKYISPDQSEDGNIYIEFDSEEDLTMFMLRFS